ncbi:MBL fold metallo-hydrolase [Prosthecobacter sp.]|uniref:MBL fold metallo-hydrolase n=1 Tax=Prosthecobacter sp. TaxID=1965333 RepID=UPI001D5C44FC|nr:MBL fold metallo-hydrolase [Prosthecobacter sp.]MCB1276397.1 MBL fold metallo-hydrolase [Prosthecobacter sp.]
MIAAFQKDDELLANISSASVDEDTLHVWWLGQSGFLIQWAGERLLFDPYLSESLTQKYAATDKPHVRMTERCIDPARLTGITRVTASHVHTDHLDGETLRLVAEASPGFRLYLPHPIIPEALKRLGDAEVILCGIGDRDRYAEGRWELRGVVAKHNEVLRDEEGRCHYTGFIVNCGPFTIYHSGDTLWHDDILTATREVNCDLMLLPINGNKPERRVAGNLNGTEAAAMAKAGGAALVVPCHYDMFEFNTETPDEFVAACGRLQQSFRVMRCGERLELRARTSGHRAMA